MGIGRRKFLALFGTTLAGLAVVPSAAVALDDDLYLNRKLGVAFRKPRGWHYASVREMGAMVEGQLLAIDDATLHAELREMMIREDLPIATMTETPFDVDTGLFTPGISAFVEPVEPEDEDPPGVARFDQGNMRRLFRDVSVISGVVASNVSQCPAADYQVAFLFEHEKLTAATPIRMRVLVIHQDQRRYVFRMYDSVEQPIDFDRFIEGIRIL